MSSKRFFWLTFVISLLFLGLCVFLPAWQLLPDIKDAGTIPLHYNIHFGVDAFGLWWHVFFIPIIGAAILIFNYFIALLYWKKEKVLSYLLVATALLVQFFLLLAMIFVVLFNLAYG